MVPIPGKRGELGYLLATAERALVEWGYRFDRTERPYDATRGVQAYAIFMRPGEPEERPTTGWLT